MISQLQLPDNPTLHDYQEYIAAMVKERGFTDNVPQRFQLLMEELGEFARAARKHGGLKFAADTHTTELEEEAADVFIVFLGMCNLLDIDLETAFRAKEEKNKKREWK
jgi:NTP pyrophosphatase (non-canonical NTP hydrolase)